MMRNVNNRFEILEEIPLNLALIEANRSFFSIYLTVSCTVVLELFVMAFIFVGVTI